MAWLAKLDAKAARWPKPVYAVYFFVKWYLVIAGGFLLANYYLHRIGFPSLWPTQ